MNAMRTVGDVRADVDRALRDLDKMRIADLAPLIARVEKLATGHPEIIGGAIERIRRRLPAPLMMPAVPADAYRHYGWFSTPLCSVPPPPSCVARPQPIERPIEHVSPCELAFDRRVPAGRTTITSRSQLVFRGELLVVPEECIDGDLIEILVGGRPQAFAAGGPRPLSLYCPARWAEPKLMEKAQLSMDTATVAQNVSLVVDMRKPVRFQAVIRGNGAR